MDTQLIASREIILFPHFEYAGCQPVSAKGYKAKLGYFLNFTYYALLNSWSYKLKDECHGSMTVCFFHGTWLLPDLLRAQAELIHPPLADPSNV